MTDLRSVRAALFRAPNTPLELVDVALPEPGPQELLIDVLCCTLCASDLHTLHGRRRSPAPSILGHEIVGRVASLGSDVASNVSVGDRVTWSLVIPCGSCRACSRGEPASCTQRFKYGHETLDAAPLSGGLASACLLRPGTHIYAVPDSLSDACAAMASCAGATAHASLRIGGPVRDREVVIFGAGLLGLCACDFARQLGAAHVLVVEPDASRAQRALRFGASDITTPEALPARLSELCDDGADLSIEMSGSAGGVRDALRSLRTGGTAVLVGSVFPGPAVDVVPEDLVRRRLTVRGQHNYEARDLEAALRLLATSPAPYEETFTEACTLEDFAQRTSVNTPAGALRIVVEPVRRADSEPASADS